MTTYPQHQSTIKELNGIVMDLNEYEDNLVKVYGFTCYRPNGHSLPKGFLSSFAAQCRKPAEGTMNDMLEDIHIEFSFQSPTGDSSDHHRYSYPCLSWEQAKEIVIRNYVTTEVMLDEFTLQYASTAYCSTVVLGSLGGIPHGLIDPESPELAV